MRDAVRMKREKQFRIDELTKEFDKTRLKLDLAVKVIEQYRLKYEHSASLR